MNGMQELTLQAAPLPALPPGAPAAAPACGWWESSLELSRGLRVIEHDDVLQGLVAAPLGQLALAAPLPTRARRGVPPSSAAAPTRHGTA